MYKKVIKRILDIVLSLIALVIALIPMLVVALLVRTKLGSPVLFTQERPGKDGKIFKLYKFRTMKDAVDAAGNPLPDEERLTPFGKKLRATSLDELPEFINILKGEMSLIGPRPLLVRYLPRYNEKQRRRHDVRPGLTGWAQVNGRNAISWEEKFELDVWYVDHVSFLLDCKIVWMTIRAIIGHTGISSATSATMEEFMGSEDKS